MRLAQRTCQSIIGIGLALIFSVLAGFLQFDQIARAQTSFVHAVLFYSPSCGHCEKVITQDLPPLLEQYGDQLKIIGVNVEDPGGQQLYRAAVEQFQIPDDRLGVPLLIVGNTTLFGSLEIPEQFPAIIEAGLQSGGIPWPEIPGLAEALPEETQEPVSPTLPATDPESIPQSVQVTGPDALSQSPTWRDKFSRDLEGNSLSVIVLVGMLVSAVAIGYRFLTSRPPGWPSWVTPLLAVLGLAIAIYLSYVEITLSEAACGPIGDCNTVQQSTYARLFGILPVGVLGVVGYVAILVAWLVGNFAPQPQQKWAKYVTWGLAWFGLLFSIYLTFLEPFVIGATCIWCLSSAVIMTLIVRSTIPETLRSSRRRHSAHVAR